MSWNFGLDFGSALGAGIGAIFSNASARQQYKYQSRLQKQAAQLNYAYSLKSAENMPTSTRTGLENAGYNPMLAVQNGTSGANASFTNAGNAVAPDYAGGVASGLSNVLSVQNMKNQTRQADSTVKLNEANTRNAIQDSISKEIHNKYLPEREQKELGQIGAETDKLIRETSYFDQLAENMEAERRLQEMGINLDYRARIYGADKGYAGTVYNADTNERNNIRTNRTTRGRIGGPLGMSGYKGQFNSSAEDYYDMLPYKYK